MIESDADNLPCPECGIPLGDHTLRDYREHTKLDLAFEEQPDVIFDRLGTGATVVDHVIVVASVMQVTTRADDTVILPAIEFRFSSSAGAEVQPIVFVSDDPQAWPGLRRLISAACDTAPMRAKQVERAANRAALKHRREAS